MMKEGGIESETKFWRALRDCWTLTGLGPKNGWRKWSSAKDSSR
jgi:hypothetical protein